MAKSIDANMVVNALGAEIGNLQKDLVIARMTIAALQEEISELAEDKPSEGEK